LGIPAFYKARASGSNKYGKEAQSRIKSEDRSKSWYSSPTDFCCSVGLMKQIQQRIVDLESGRSQRLTFVTVTITLLRMSTLRDESVEFICNALTHVRDDNMMVYAT